MTTNLYALKEDLDMLNTQVQDIKMGYGALDYIVKTVTDLKLEQQFQAVQMRRIEARLDGHDVRFVTLEASMDSLRQDVDSSRNDIDCLRQDVDGLRQDMVEFKEYTRSRFDAIEATLLLITKHLGIA
jgi:polyhydroxyalkanoate synthesis regulator phasin